MGRPVASSAVRPRPGILAILTGASLFAALIAALFAPPSARADEGRDDPGRGVFVQIGAADRTESIVVGLVHDLRWRRSFGAWSIGGYLEVALGRWLGDDRDFTQFGITPVLRIDAHGRLHGWFAELGIGANAIWPRYTDGPRRFGSVFNFGDHVGIGRRFGADARHALVLRYQHFSNADLREPNPGENFLQLRYLRRF